MMSVRLQVGIIVVMVLVAGIIVHFLRKKSIDFRYALAWLFVDICIVILALFPQVMIWLAGVLGIAAPVNMVLFMGLCLALVVIFLLSMSVSRLSDKVRKLSQEIAIIRKDVYDGDNRVRDEMKSMKR
ncbi:MAG: DUF2304 domain-containing protein [Lachnospiraceae bacterium]|nr:DUF2304 domain-containing protein [Lachnospiraceae bacterium]